MCLVVLYSLVCIILALVLSPRPSQSHVVKNPPYHTYTYRRYTTIHHPSIFHPSIHHTSYIHTYIIAHVYTDFTKKQVSYILTIPPTTLTYPIPASPHLPFFRRSLVIPVVFLRPLLAHMLACSPVSLPPVVEGGVREPESRARVRKGAACLAFFCSRLFEAGVVHVFVSVVPCPLSHVSLYCRYGLGANRCYYGCICMVLWSYPPKRYTRTPLSPLFSACRRPLKWRSLKVTATVTLTIWILLCVLVHSLARLPDSVTRKHELLRP